MIEFKDISNLTLNELFQELGIADYTYVETSNFLEQLEGYRQTIHLKIKEKQNEPSKSLDSRKSG
jgi:hypothetical protein